jgi:hypothetical protein
LLWQKELDVICGAGDGVNFFFVAMKIGSSRAEPVYLADSGDQLLVVFLAIGAIA